MYQPPQKPDPYWQPGQFHNGTPLPPQYPDVHSQSTQFDNGPSLPPQKPDSYWQPGQFHNGTPLPPSKPTVAQRFKSLPKNTQFGLGCGEMRPLYSH